MNVLRSQEARKPGSQGVRESGSQEFKKSGRSYGTCRAHSPMRKSTYDEAKPSSSRFFESTSEFKLLVLLA